MTSMTGFSGFDRFDAWVLKAVICFMLITVYMGMNHPQSMHVGTMLLAALFSGMFAAGRLLWSFLPKPAGYKGLWRTIVPKPQPLRVLTSMSTMSRHQLNSLGVMNMPVPAAMVIFRDIYKSCGMNRVTYFTVDRRDRAYDYHGIADACAVPNRQEGMVNIFWYEEQETTPPDPAAERPWEFPSLTESQRLKLLRIAVPSAFWLQDDFFSGITGPSQAFFDAFAKRFNHD